MYFVQLEVTPTEMEVKRYDYIYNKYHEDPRYSYITDFIGRLEAGTMQSSYSVTFFRIDTQAMNSTISSATEIMKLMDCNKDLF